MNKNIFQNHFLHYLPIPLTKFIYPVADKSVFLLLLLLFGRHECDYGQNNMMMN